MSRLNQAYAEEAARRLAALQPDAKPKWGKMTVPQLYGHLTAAVLYSMGEGNAMRVRGKAATRFVFRPLILNGWYKIPRNIQLPRPKDKPAPPMAEGTLEELSAAMTRFVEAADNGKSPSHPHPFLGDIGIKGWQKFHYRHFEHHLEQFGV